jgi:hypothetical protein
MNEIQILLDRYVGELRAAAQDASDATDHCELMERLAATHRMQIALDANDMGRLAAELNEEARSLGWSHAAGARGAAAHACVMELERLTQSARLEGKPDAW